MSELLKHFQDKIKIKNMTFKLLKSDGTSYEHKKSFKEVEKSIEHQIKGLKKQLLKEGLNMNKYTIDFQNGLTEDCYAANLDEALKQVEQGIMLTQKSIKIINESGDTLATLPFYRSDPSLENEDIEIVAQFGKIGFYSSWIF